MKGVAELEEELQHLKRVLAAEEAATRSLDENTDDVGVDLVYPSTPGELVRLRKSNTALRRTLEKLRRAERVLSNDPQVLDKRNAVAAVWKDVARVQEEVDTLELVRRQWRKGIEAVRAQERSLTAIRGQQNEEMMELRGEMRDLTEELKAAEKLDAQLHRRCALLQQQQLLNVLEEDVARLTKRRGEQEERIKELKGKGDELKTRRTTLMDDNRRLLFKEGRAKAKMEKDIEDLKALLLQRDEELGQIYRAAGRLRTGELL